MGPQKFTEEGFAPRKLASHIAFLPPGYPDIPGALDTLVFAQGGDEDEGDKVTDEEMADDEIDGSGSNSKVDDASGDNDNNEMGSSSGNGNNEMDELDLDDEDGDQKDDGTADDETGSVGGRRDPTGTGRVHSDATGGGTDILNSEPRLRRHETSLTIEKIMDSLMPATVQTLAGFTLRLWMTKSIHR